MATDNQVITRGPGLAPRAEYGGFALLVAGQALSTLGDMLFVVALPFIVLRQPHGTTILTLLLGVYTVSRLLTTVPGGRLADRIGPRAVLIGADVGRAALLLGAWLVAGRGWIALLICVAGIGALDGAFLPAYRSMTPRLVRPERMMLANGIGEGANLAAVVVGPLLAAGLVQAGVGVLDLLAIDAVTFAVSAVLLLGVRVRSLDASAEDRDDEVADGALSMLRRTPVRELAIVMAVVGMATAGAIAVGLPIAAAGHGDVQLAGFGLFLACHGAGMLVGGGLSPLLARLGGSGRIVAGLLLLDAVLFACWPQLSGLGAAAAGIAAIGVIDGLLAVTTLTFAQLLTTDRTRGRAMAALSVVSGIAAPVSILLAGAVATLIGTGAPFWFSGVMLVVAAVFVIRQPVLREARLPRGREPS